MVDGAEGKWILQIESIRTGTRRKLKLGLMWSCILYLVLELPLCNSLSRKLSLFSLPLETFSLCSLTQKLSLVHKTLSSQSMTATLIGKEKLGNK